MLFRESSFNMTRGGDEDIEGGLRKFLDTRRGGSKKIVALGGGTPKICMLQNQHMTSSYRLDGFQLNYFNDLCNSAISRGLQI